VKDVVWEPGESTPQLIEPERQALLVQLPWLDASPASLPA
jgi:hypothetical protein